MLDTDGERIIGTGLSSVGETVKKNAIPVSLVVLGLGWFVVGRFRNASDGGLAPQEKAFGAKSGGIPKDETQAGIEYIAPIGQPVLSRSELRNRAEKIAERAKERTKRIPGEARKRGKGFAAKLGQTAREHSLALGLAAIAVGAALGLAVRETRKDQAATPEGSDMAPQEKGPSETQALYEYWAMGGDNEESRRSH
jgi:hypothetical protein